MATNIHPTAVIDRTAEIADGIEVGPFAIVGPRVKLGKNTRVRAHAHIISDTVTGENCDIYPHAVVGGDPQDLKYKGEQTLLVIGNNNIIRECTTINRGTQLGGGKTVMGDHNLIMAYVHIAHDCVIGDRCIITNGAQLAGHIKMEDMSIISGMVLVHHFVTIGMMSFCAPFSAIRNDVPPYMIVDGAPARVRKLNIEGLRRRGMTPDNITALKAVFKMVYRAELSRADALTQIAASPYASDPTIENLVTHYRASEAGFQGRALEAFRSDRNQQRQTEEED